MVRFFKFLSVFVFVVNIITAAFGADIAIGESSRDCDSGSNGIGATPSVARLAAEWIPNVVSLSWYNGGDILSGQSSCTYDTSFSVPSAPTRLGYVFDGWKVTSIPVAYTRLQYITSTGTQCIDTGVLPTSDNITYRWEALDNSGNGTTLFGSEGGSPKTYNDPLYGNKTSRKVYVGSGATVDDTTGYYTSADNVFHTWSFVINSDHTLYLVKDGTALSTIAWAGSLNKSVTVALFCNHTGSTFAEKASASFKYFKIYDSNQIVFDGVPVRRNSDNVVGIWDTVSQTFFTDVGSGKFVGGPPVTTPYDFGLIDPSVDGTERFAVNGNSSCLYSNGAYSSYSTITCDSRYDDLQDGEWKVKFPNWMIYGDSLCSTTAVPSGEGEGYMGSPVSADGQYCWCKVTQYRPNNRNIVYAPNNNVPFVYDWNYNTYSNCSANCAKACTMDTYSKVSFRRPLFGQALPSGYTKLQYIGSTGTQYINTNYVLTENDEVEVDYTLTNLSNTGDKMIIAQQVDNNKGMWVETYGNTNQWYVRFGSTASVNAAFQNSQTSGTFIIKKGSFSINGTTILTPSYSGMSTYPMTIFGRHNSSGTLQYPAYVRISEVRIKNGASIIHKYVPARNSSNVVGLFDTISGSFYTNAGSGTFDAGPDAN